MSQSGKIKGIEGVDICQSDDVTLTTLAFKMTSVAREDVRSTAMNLESIACLTIRCQMTSILQNSSL